MKKILILSFATELKEKEVSEQEYQAIAAQADGYGFLIHDLRDCEGWASMENYDRLERLPIEEAGLFVADERSRFVGAYLNLVSKAIDIEGFLDLEGNYRIKKTKSWTNDDDGDRYLEAEAWLEFEEIPIRPKEDAATLLINEDNRI